MDGLPLRPRRDTRGKITKGRKVCYMKLRELTTKNAVEIDVPLKTKEEVIRYLVKKLAQDGKLHSQEQFFSDVMTREAMSPTGLEQGIAIPHGKSKAVKEASFAVAKLRTPIEGWESVVENNQVEMVFLLAIPEEEAGSTHLDVLSTLATRIATPSYLQRLLHSRNADELYENLDTVVEDEAKSSMGEPTKSIVAVTACPAGIAHTYMAAEALQRAGRELGIAVYVEKQGANGIEDPHTEEQLKNAEVAIFATDVAVKKEERYSHLCIHRTSVAAPLKDARSVIEKALLLSKGKDKKDYLAQNGAVQAGSDSFGEEVKKSILTGISYIIPIIVAGGMLLAFSVLVAQAFGLQELFNKEGSWLWMFRKLGGNMLGTLMIPVLSAYMAYSIADKPALGPGFAAGVAANLINGGFIGGMLGGFIAGYLLRYMRKMMPAKGVFKGFISFWVYPVFGSLIVGALMLLVLGKPVSSINEGLLAWLGSLSGGNALLLGAVLGIMVSFDLGGPVNKAAYTFCLGAMASGNFIPYAAFASVKMVSAFSCTAATVLFKQYFEDFEQDIGKSTWLLGLAGITEGAIPFMIEDPLRVIPSFCIGSAVTGAFVVYTQIGLPVPGAGIFSLFLLKGTSAWYAASIWLGAALVGAAISTALLVLTRVNKLKGLARNNEAGAYRPSRSLGS
jgi:2-O-A-mannosyl-D-glycerate PTS system EIIABC component